MALMSDEIAYDPPPRRSLSWRWLAVPVIVIAVSIGVAAGVALHDERHHARPVSAPPPSSLRSAGPTLVFRAPALRSPITSGMTTGVALSATDIWLANWDRGRVSAYDRRTGRLRFTIPVGGPQSGPESIASGAGFIWVLDFGDSQLLRVDPSSGQITRRGSLVGLGEPLQVAYSAGAVWLTTDGSRYPGDRREHVFKLDPRNLKVLAERGLPGEGAGGLVAADRRGIWVNSPGNPQLALLSASTLRTIVKTNIPVGQDRPQIVAASSGVWVLTDTDLRRLDPYSGYATTIIPTPAPASLPAALSVDRNGAIWIAGGGALQFFTPATGWRSVAGISDARAVVTDDAHVWVTTGDEVIALNNS